MASAHNVASVVRTAAGRYRVHFAVAMPDANYCWTELARSSTNTGQQRVALVGASSDVKTAQYVDVSCATAAASFDDSSEINLVVYR
jgi:CelD/BcsL family acetyltransferase involved in cellulose biosynthesis